ncbi:MAG: SDR family NAD(P)-dependent oxidoreductase [Gemmatimonadota bacterium]
MMDLTGNVALVTGGSRGIGAATVRLLAAAGAQVGFTYQDRVEAAAALAAELGSAVRGWRVDVRDADGLARVVRELGEAWGGLDILVANAGIWRGAPIAEMSVAEWQETLDVNLTGTFLACRAAVPALVARGGGSIVVVSSTAGQRGEAGHSHYAATKGAQLAFVKSLAVECAPAIRVNAVAPGWVDTDLSAPAYQGAGREAIERAIPLGRVASADDIARGIVFLASDWARHITGEVLNINGGAVLCG